MKPKVSEMGRGWQAAMALGREEIHAEEVRVEVVCSR